MHVRSFITNDSRNRRMKTENIFLPIHRFLEFIEFDHFDDLVRYILTSIPFFLSAILRIRSFEEKECLRSLAQDIESRSIVFFSPSRPSRVEHCYYNGVKRDEQQHRMTGSLPIPSSNCRNRAVSSTTDTKQVDRKPGPSFGYVIPLIRSFLPGKKFPDVFYNFVDNNVYVKSFQVFFCERFAFYRELFTICRLLFTLS